ncbi:MAG: FtsQ-type POTRA domain-containing protein [Candidatus Omnitrophica bacterium]|nr:FtsQ-type POTRA domain-containing protein [Candidatus Omnitrophota bacterium]
MARKKNPNKKNAERGATFDLLSMVDGRAVLFCIIVMVFLAGGVLAFKNFLMFSDYFAIKQVVVNKSCGDLTAARLEKLRSEYAGTNIFTVDLKQIGNAIIKDYPDSKDVIVKRVMPDVLHVDIVSRIPAAVINYGDGIAIDDEGIALDKTCSKKGLVKILGVNLSRPPSVGEKVRSQALMGALDLLDIVRRVQFRGKGFVESIDVSGRENIVLKISGISVKIRLADFESKIGMLEEILKDPKINSESIEYIDLRFEKIVIAPKK